MEDKILYSLCTQDILAVAENMGISEDKITDDVIRTVEKWWENLEWYEVTELALEDALKINE